MTDEQILDICTANKNNVLAYHGLDNKTQEMCLSMLMALDANEFKEFNKDAEFEFLDLPVPIAQLDATSASAATFTPDIQDDMNKLLILINKEGTNLEYPFVLSGEKEGEAKYDRFEYIPQGGSMGELQTQSVSWDNQKLNEKLREVENGGSFSLFHTHPKPIDQQHKTLYNQHQELFAQFGVKPDGLNLSLADVAGVAAIDQYFKQVGKDVVPESTILMHDGSLVSFSTRDGLKLTSQLNLQLDRAVEREAQDQFGITKKH